MFKLIFLNLFNRSCFIILSVYVSRYTFKIKDLILFSFCSNEKYRFSINNKPVDNSEHRPPFNLASSRASEFLG